ncbi:MAG: hypothetical protein Q8906_11775, partial [Bacillota bacterium]|nr:hypothetical protein [Bacillota bacterium]
MKKKMIMGILALAAWFSVSNPLVASYIGKMKMGAVPALKQEDPLVQQIRKNAPKYEIPPSDAKLDPIWKAIPGYNGLSVNILSSYKRMKKAGTFNEEKLVFT